MHLNYDVLLHIMSLADQRETVLAMMQTCRTLHPPSMPKLLSFPVTLGHHSDQNKSFLNYILADVSSRARHIQKLVLEISVCSLPCSLADFAMLIQNCTNLKCLNFVELGIEDLLNVDEIGALHAIAGLTSIRVMSAKITGQMTQRLLAEMKSPLRSLTVVADERSGWEIDLSVALSAFSNSLKSIHATCLPFSSVSFVYPNVTSFSSEGIECNTLSILLHSFPNLQRLEVCHFGDRFDDDDEDSEGREDNRDVQSKNGLSWKRLQYLAGDITSLHRLGVLSQVDYLKVESFPFENASKFREIAEDAKPSAVWVIFDGPLPGGKCGEEDSQEPLIEGLFNILTLQDVIAEIVMLQLPSVWEIWEHARGAIVSMFKSTPAKTLTLTILSRDSLIPAPPLPDADAQPLRIRIEELARGISTVAPSLETIVINAPKLARMGWNIHRDGDHHELLPKPTEECTRTLMAMCSKFNDEDAGL